jgi:transposase
MAAEHIMHMQKALSQMNLQLHHVLSQITGLSGQKILDAILAGERDPMRLASLCNGRVKSSRETVAKSLEGDYREEHLFALRQSLVGYRFYQTLIAEVDQELELKMRKLPRTTGGPEQMPPRTKACFYQRADNEPAFDLKGELFRIAGVDLTDVPGISAITAHTILMEVGPDLSRFPNASAFAAWLGLCPEKQISGGKVLYTRSRKVKNRAAIALRLGAHCLYRAKNYWGEFYRRMRWRLGARGGNCNGTQACTHCLSPAFHQGALFRECPGSLRPPGEQAGRNTIAQTSRQPRLSTDTHTRTQHIRGCSSGVGLCSSMGGI